MLFKLIYANKSKRVHKSFLFFTFSLSTKLLEDKKRFKLGGVDTFPNAFPLVLDSNLHDLNDTNPGLMLFSAELP